MYTLCTGMSVSQFLRYLADKYVKLNMFIYDMFVKRLLSFLGTDSPLTLYFYLCLLKRNALPPARSYLKSTALCLD